MKEFNIVCTGKSVTFSVLSVFFALSLFIVNPADIFWESLSSFLKGKQHDVSHHFLLEDFNFFVTFTEFSEF